MPKAIKLVCPLVHRSKVRDGRVLVKSKTLLIGKLKSIYGINVVFGTPVSLPSHLRFPDIVIWDTGVLNGTCKLEEGINGSFFLLALKFLYGKSPGPDFKCAADMVSLQHFREAGLISLSIGDVHY
ncbi:hypothetical protein VNO77_04194 [Canavalia gladiata]|uniref:Uncharacterized protein n=1 Tax=Canavalia gladiata TaxID=3824 RepID=A0AAN9N1R8_CANGL